MHKTYQHLSVGERFQIKAWLVDRLSVREIARRLGRSASTISREIERNIYVYPDSTQRVVYIPDHADVRARKRRDRRFRSCERVLLKGHRIQKYVESKLRLGWSPEQIAGRMRRCKEEVTVSHEAIYQWLYKERRDLLDCLVRHHKHRHRKKQRKSFCRNDSIYDDYSITQRPKRISSRREFGHWESDSVQSPFKDGALHVAVERKTRVVTLSKLRSNTSEEVKAALLRKMSALPRKATRTITYDHGRENSKHLEINDALRSKSYFCDRYAAWQKGTVENTIGVIRRTFPRGTDFKNLSSSSIEELERFLNQKPRKCLLFATPMEAFDREIVALQL